MSIFQIPRTRRVDAKAIHDVVALDSVIENSAIIVQARMTSHRFPGKSMAKLGGIPVIGRVLQRAMLVSNVERIILASPETKEQWPMFDYVKSYFPQVTIFEGSEWDVLGRYYDAANKFDLDYIVRITGDCPFIDPVLVRDTIDLLYNNGDMSYCSNVYPTRTFYKGLDCEAFTIDLLERAQYEAKSPEYREHVTLWMQEQKDIVKGLIRARYDQSNDYNLCVDYPEDIQRLSNLLSKIEFTELNSATN